MKKIIMISGSSFGAGKDTVGEMLEKKYTAAGKRVRHMAFADWVRMSLKMYYGWNGLKDDNGRALMQHYATDEVRFADPDYWAEVVARLAAATKEDWDVLIITDFRFPNEYTVMTKYFEFSEIYTIRVDREEIISKKHREHVSEHSLENFGYDVILNNSGTLEDLENNVNCLFKELST